MRLEQHDQVYLKSEFQKMGFDIKNIDLGNEHSNPFDIKIMLPITDPRIPAEHFAALITIFITKDQKPAIEVIHAAFLNSALNELAQLSYSCRTVKGLPTKEQIFEELTEVLCLKNTQEKFGINRNNTYQQDKNEIKHKRRL